MRCVGYRQAWVALDEGKLKDLRDAGIVATRQLAKRQLTWLRSMRQRQVVACDAPDALAQVLRLARAFVARQDGLRLNTRKDSPSHSVVPDSIRDLKHPAFSAADNAPKGQA